MTQTKNEIRSMLAAAGIRPRKRFGQHFLIDGNLLRKLVSTADPCDRDVVLEVGPGTGALTEELVARAGHVVAVEIDAGLHAICQSRFAFCERVTLIHGDVLERKSAIARDVLQMLADRQETLGGRIMLVANLPYQVATPLLIDLLMGELTVSRLCFTVQAEVADRLLASPGSKTYGPISVFAQALAAVERIARVPPEAFWPVSKVDSATLQMVVHDDGVMSPGVQRRLSEVVHGCFRHRRKTMKSNLRRLLGEVSLRHLESDGRWELAARPEQITVAQWMELAAWLSAADPGRSARRSGAERQH